MAKYADQINTTAHDAAPSYTPRRGPLAESAWTRRRFTIVCTLALLASLVIGLVGMTTAAYTDVESGDTDTVTSGQFDIEYSAGSGVFASLIGTDVKASNADATKVDPVCGTGTSMTYTEDLTIALNSGASNGVVSANLAVFGSTESFSTANSANTSLSAFTVELFNGTTSAGSYNAVAVEQLPADNKIPDSYPVEWPISGANSTSTTYTLVWTWTMQCSPWDATTAALDLPARSFLMEQVASS